MHAAGDNVHFFRSKRVAQSYLNRIGSQKCEIFKFNGPYVYELLIEFRGFSQGFKKLHIMTEHYLSAILLFNSSYFFQGFKKG